MPTIVIDAARGGYDTGSVNGERLEKNDNLRLALAVGTFLTNCGFDVVYTRNTDVFVPLAERINTSNNANADMFVSLQRSASTNPNTNGVEAWVHQNASSNAVIAASYILDNLVSTGVQENRGIRYGNFAVLRETKAPAVLVSLGFITNEEDNYLFDKNFSAYAYAIANGIARSFGHDCELGELPPPTTQPPPFPSPEDYRTQVKAIQDRLNTQYHQNLVVDGIWGPLSNRAMIRAYQTELNNMFGAGLVVDGIWGPRTRAATRLVRLGDNNNLVWILQSMLYVYGFPTTPDGIFGAHTDITLRNYQRANDLAIDGIAGPNTFESLFTKSHQLPY